MFFAGIFKPPPDSIQELCTAFSGHVFLVTLFSRAVLQDFEGFFKNSPVRLFCRMPITLDQFRCFRTIRFKFNILARMQPGWFGVLPVASLQLARVVMWSCSWRCWAGTPGWGTTPWAGNPSSGSCSYELYASYSLFSPHSGQGDILTVSITSGPSFAYPLSHGFSSLPGNSRFLALTFIVQHDLPLPTFWPCFASLSSLFTVFQLPGHLSAFLETPPPLHPWFLLPEKLWQGWILLITQVSVQISRFHPYLIFSPSFCLWSTDHHLILSIYLFIHWLVYCLPHPTGPQAPRRPIPGLFCSPQPRQPWIKLST